MIDVSDAPILRFTVEKRAKPLSKSLGRCAFNTRTLIASSQVLEF